MGKTRDRTGAIGVTLLAVGLLTLAWGRTDEGAGVAETGGGQGAGSAGGSGEAGAGGAANVVCPAEQSVAVLSPSTHCHVEERKEDPAFTCEFDPRAYSMNDCSVELGTGGSRVTRRERPPCFPTS